MREGDVQYQNTMVSTSIEGLSFGDAESDYSAG
jgi:hypothetical protein